MSPISLQLCKVSNYHYHNITIIIIIIIKFYKIINFLTQKLWQRVQLKLQVKGMSHIL